MAANEYSGDDNLRLGFEVHGLLDARTDADVYNFNAVAGTEVWFDIDNTDAALDTVLELVDSSGNVIARSDNSVDESENTALIYTDGIDASHANPLDKARQEIPDHFTVNDRDAGLRIVMPGTLVLPRCITFVFPVRMLRSTEIWNYNYACVKWMK